MNQTPAPDLHVRSLSYSVESGEGVTYVDPSPLEFERQGANFHLAAGYLTCEMRTHFSNVEAARAVVEPILRAWELDSDLRTRPGELRFHFAGADVKDRTPVPPGVIRGTACIVQPGPATVCATGIVSVHVTRGEYPEPPAESFCVTLDADQLRSRYLRYLDGHDSLQNTAYFCLTRLQKNAGGRKRAGRRYGIDEPVLDKVRDLASTRGDHLTARKADVMRPMTGVESAWLDAAIKMLIRRLADTPPDLRA